MWTVKLALFFMPFFLQSCQKRLLAKNSCATPLIYQTNPLSSGEQALKYASIYRAPISVGRDNLKILAIVDTGSANLIINEKDYRHNFDTVTGDKTFTYKNGIDEAMAINAKDNMDIACTTDIPTRFAITAKDVNTDNYLGLGLSNPKKHAHEKFSSPFLDQLVKEGYQDVFSLAFCGPTNSRLVLGGIDPDMMNFVGNFVPILEKTDYTIPVLNIRRSDNKKVIAKFKLYDPSTLTGDRVIIDSSSPFLLLPTNIAGYLVAEIEREAKSLGMKNMFPDGFFRTERSSTVKVARFLNKAQIKQLPTFEINVIGVDGKAKALKLTPFNYLKEMDTKDPLFRALAIRDSAKDTILGQPFLESQYTYFDRENELIGFGNIDIACAD